MKIRRERATACEDGLAVCVLHGLLVCAFGITRRVRKWENNWVLVELGHALQDVLVEDAADGGQPHENGWLDVVDNFSESLVLLTVIITAGEILFMLSKVVASVVGNETL